MNHGHKQKRFRSIDFYSANSRLRGWNAGLKMGVGMAALCLCVGANRLPVSLFILISMGAFTVGAGGLSLSRYLKLLTVPAAFLLTGTAAIAAGVSRAPYGDYYAAFPWFCLYVTKSGLWQAFLLIVRALGAVSAMYMMALTTPVGEIIGVLKRIHVPGLIVELMYLIYRFIFVLMDTHGQMKQAATSRMGYGDFATSCRTFGRTAGNLLVASLRKADVYYDSMLSRCYAGDLCFLEEKKEIKLWQAVFSAAYLMVIGIVWLVFW